MLVPQKMLTDLVIKHMEVLLTQMMGNMMPKLAMKHHMATTGIMVMVIAAPTVPNTNCNIEQRKRLFSRLWRRCACRGGCCALLSLLGACGGFCVGCLWWALISHVPLLSCVARAGGWVCLEVCDGSQLICWLHYCALFRPLQDELWCSMQGIV